MPKKGSGAKAAPLPPTLKRSPKKAQATYEKTLESAEKSYGGNEERAHRAAWSSVKHGFEKVGDHWEPKKRKGPSDPRARSGGPEARGESFRGVDVAGKTKAELTEEARRLGVNVSSRMTKAEVGRAIERGNDKATRKARSKKR